MDKSAKTKESLKDIKETALAFAYKASKDLIVSKQYQFHVNLEVTENLVKTMANQLGIQEPVFATVWKDFQG